MLVSLIREQDETSTYTHHDQLFKELIHTFFEEFLEAFFPEVYNSIDFSSIHPLTGETFTDLHEGESRTADIVIEAKVKHQDTIIIIHIEPQSYQQTNFHERMYMYFSLLYNKYRKPILPIAIFTYDNVGNEKNEFHIQFPFFDVLSFRFLTLPLRKMNWRQYIQSDNPVAAALLSKMGFHEDERIQVRKEFLRMLVRMKLNPAKERYIYGFFESYLKFNEVEEEILVNGVKNLDKDEAMKIMDKIVMK